MELSFLLQMFFDVFQVLSKYLFLTYFQVLSEGGFQIQIKKTTKTTAGVFPRGLARGNQTMTTSRTTARRKGDPQHMLSGRTIIANKVSCTPWSEKQG